MKLIIPYSFFSLLWDDDPSVYFNFSSIFDFFHNATLKSGSREETKQREERERKIAQQTPDSNEDRKIY